MFFSQEIRQLTARWRWECLCVCMRRMQTAQTIEAESASRNGSTKRMQTNNVQAVRVELGRMDVMQPSLPATYVGEEQGQQPPKHLPSQSEGFGGCCACVPSWVGWEGRSMSKVRPFVFCCYICSNVPHTLCKGKTQFCGWRFPIILYSTSTAWNNGIFYLNDVVFLVVWVFFGRLFSVLVRHNFCKSVSVLLPRHFLAKTGNLVVVHIFHISASIRIVAYVLRARFVGGLVLYSWDN